MALKTIGDARMRDFDLVIFDCDGVLIDSEIIACAAEAEALTRFGYPISAQDVSRRFTGMPDKAMDAIITAELGYPLPPEARAEAKKTIMSRFRTDLKAVRGAEKFIRQLKIPGCVASSSSPSKLALGLVETGLFGLLYPAIYSTALVKLGKPHPDLFLHAAGDMDVPARRCVVIEDSVAGVTAAVAAEMYCIGFTGGSHCTEGHAEKLIAAGASYVAADYADIHAVTGGARPA